MIASAHRVRRALRIGGVPAEFLAWLNDSGPAQAVQVPIIQATGSRPYDGSPNWDFDSDAIQRVTAQINAGTAVLFRIALRPTARAAELAIPQRTAATNVERGAILADPRAEHLDLRIANLNVRRLGFLASETSCTLRLEHCWIDGIEFPSPGTGSVHLEIHDSWIGRIIIDQNCFGVVRLTSGGLLSAECALANKPNPFRNSVSIGRKFYLPRYDGEYKNQSTGHLPWTSMRMHLAAVGNFAAAGRVHSVELAFERAEDPIAAQLVSVCYGFFSSYGNSIGRPLIWLFASWILGLFVIVSSAGAKLALNSDQYTNWKYVLAARDYNAYLARSSLLSIEPILNPLGLLRRDTLVEAAYAWLQVMQSIQSYFSAILLFLLALAIRRKFKITS